MLRVQLDDVGVCLEYILSITIIRCLYHMHVLCNCIIVQMYKVHNDSNDQNNNYDSDNDIA